MSSPLSLPDCQTFSSFFGVDFSNMHKTVLFPRNSKNHLVGLLLALKVLQSYNYVFTFFWRTKALFASLRDPSRPSGRNFLSERGQIDDNIILLMGFQLKLNKKVFFFSSQWRQWFHDSCQNSKNMKAIKNWISHHRMITNLILYKLIKNDNIKKYCS